MKIAITVPFYLPVVGGLEYHAAVLAKELMRRGQQVEVLTAAIDHDGNAIGPPQETIDGVRVCRYKVWFRLGRFGSFWPGFLGRLGKYDIIHVQNMRHPHTDLALIFGKLMGKAVVITPQAPLHEGTHSLAQEIFIKIYDNIILPIIFRFYDAIFPHHRKEMEYLQRHGAPASKMFVVPLGVGEESFKKRRRGYFNKLRRRHRHILLYVGRLSNMKGLDLLLKAFKRTGIPDRELALVLIGPDGGELAKLERLKSELKLKNVYFWGAVSEQAVEEATADADLFVLPSKYEPYGLALVKAMAKGVPCISTDRGGPTEIIEDGKTGLLCRYDEGALAGAIAKLLSDDALRKRMGLLAAKRAKLFTISRMVDAYESHYKMLVRGGKS